MIARREVLKGAGAVAAAGAVGIGMPAIVRAQAGEPMTFFTPFGFISDFIEIMNAQSGGHFRAQGFNARVLGGQGTAQAIQQLVAGQADFIRAASIDQMRAAVQTGAPLVAISTLYQGSTFHVVSPRDRPVTRAEDFRGKTVGLVSVGGTTDTFLDLMLNRVGIPRSEVRTEVTGNSPGALQMVRAGRVDCFMSAINVVVTLERAGERIEAWSTDRYAPMPSQCFVTTRDVIQRKPDSVVRFLRAMHASVQELMTQSLRPIFERASRDFEIPGIRDIDSLVAVAEAAKDRLWLSQGPENLMRNVPRLWRDGAEALRASNVVNVPDVDALYTNEFIDRVVRA